MVAERDPYLSRALGASTERSALPARNRHRSVNAHLRRHSSQRGRRGPFRLGLCRPPSMARSSTARPTLPWPFWASPDLGRAWESFTWPTTLGTPGRRRRSHR